MVPDHPFDIQFLQRDHIVVCGQPKSQLIEKVFATIGYAFMLTLRGKNSLAAFRSSSQMIYEYVYPMLIALIVCCCQVVFNTTYSTAKQGPKFKRSYPADKRSNPADKRGNPADKRSNPADSPPGELHLSWGKRTQNPPIHSP
jgi:hypothetical protein